MFCGVSHPVVSCCGLLLVFVLWLALFFCAVLCCALLSRGCLVVGCVVGLCCLLCRWPSSGGVGCALSVGSVRSLLHNVVLFGCFSYVVPPCIVVCCVFFFGAVWCCDALPALVFWSPSGSAFCWLCQVTLLCPPHPCCSPFWLGLSLYPGRGRGPGPLLWSVLGCGAVLFCCADCRALSCCLCCFLQCGCRLPRLRSLLPCYCLFFPGAHCWVCLSAVVF